MHLVPAARDHDPFQKGIGLLARRILVKISYFLNYVLFISNTSFVCQNFTSDNSKNDFFFGVMDFLRAMCCSVTSHFGANFRDEISTCLFDFQHKFVIALPIESMFYTTNVFCPLNIYFKEI